MEEVPLPEVNNVFMKNLKALSQIKNTYWGLHYFILFSKYFHANNVFFRNKRKYGKKGRDKIKNVAF